MSFSFSRLVNGVGKIALGDELGNAVLGTVGYSDDQIAAKENYRLQRKASDHAFNQNLKMWELNNSYNDPSAQMERLQAAGLNPNLVYGGGNVSGNVSGSTPTYERPNASYDDKNIQRRQLSLALKEHQQRVTNQAIENELARQRLTLAERDADRQDALAKAQIDAYKANLGLTDLKMRDITYGMSPANPKNQTLYKKAQDYFYDLGYSLGEKFGDWNFKSGEAYRKRKGK